MLVSSLTLVIVAGAMAQTFKQEPTTGELQRQLDEMRSQMIQMQNRIAELEAAKGIAATSASTDTFTVHSQIPPEQALLSQPDETERPEEPTSLHFRGLTLIPGGFLEGTMLVRTRNETEYKAERICRGRLSRCSTDCQLR